MVVVLVVVVVGRVVVVDRGGRGGRVVVVGRVVVLVVVEVVVVLGEVVVVVVLVLVVGAIVVLEVVVVVVGGGTKSKLPSEVTGERLPAWSTTWAARKTTCPAKRPSLTVSDVPASWLPRGGAGTEATGVAPSNCVWVVIGPAVENRKSNFAAVPQ